MLDTLIDRYCRFLTYLIALALAVMVVLVFGNVVLRYGFNSGIAVSEEVSRWLFVWLTFMGATVAIKEHGHLGTDFLLAKLPPVGPFAPTSGDCGCGGTTPAGRFKVEGG